MTEDELYELATGPRQGPLSDEQVREIVQEFAGAEGARRLPMRLEPSGPVPDGKKFIMPVPCEGDRYLAVSFSFGHPDRDEMLNWKPVWHSVTGPLTRAELEALPRE